MIGPDTDRAEETGQDQFASRDVSRATSHEIVTDDTQVSPQIKDVPILLPKNAQPRFRTKKRIALSRNRLDERGLAAPVGAENRHMITRLDG